VARKRLTSLLAAGTCALAAAGVASAGNGGVAPLPPASKQAGDIRDTYFYVLGFGVALLVAGLVWLSRSLAGGRAPGSVARRPAVVAAAAAVAVAGVGAYGIVKLDGARNAPGDARPVLATYDGSGWTFVHPDLGNVKEQNLLTLEEGVPAVIEISPKSAAGQFFVQQIGGAIDAVPGETTTLAVTPTVAGSFQSLQLDPATRQGKLTVRVTAKADYQGIGKGGGS
jgi:heme/copper-type cytochrome/quinol oxidase subunit 2